MIKIAVVGGGPGGLFTARLLEEKLHNFCQITVFEASDRTGGKIATRQFDSAPVIYEAGLGELYSYTTEGASPDPLRQLVGDLGLQTVPMEGQTLVLDGQILSTPGDIQRAYGPATTNAIREFRRRCTQALPLGDWYEGDCRTDNAHEWANRSCEQILDEVGDAQARKYLKVAARSDLATEPHLTNGLNGLKNFLMDVPGYIRLYSVAGGIEQIPARVRKRLTCTRIELNCPVKRISKNAYGNYRVVSAKACDAFDAVFVALPHNWLGSIEWSGEILRKAMSRFIAYYDRPGHYLRVSVLFRRPFWRDRIGGSWFMLDAFGGCCVYDEGRRHDSGDLGVLSWLIAGTDALSMSGFDDDRLARCAMASLPAPLASLAQRLFVEAKVHRWPGSVSAQPGGWPIRESNSAHVPEPGEHPGLLMVGDYLFDSTLNGVLDSADVATDLLSARVMEGQKLCA